MLCQFNIFLLTVHSWSPLHYRITVYLCLHGLAQS